MTTFSVWGDPLDPPLCNNCGEVAEPGTACPACDEHQLDAAEIEDLKAEAAISRAEDERMFPPDDYGDWGIE
jgi:hypothetical protein